MLKRVDLLAGLLIVLSLAGTARASVVLKTTVPEMTRTATLVLHGEVRAVDAHRVAGSRARIVTDVTIRVDERLKGVLLGEADGEGARHFTFTLPGGKADGFVMMIPGMPRFHVGEEVVLFLEKTSAGYAVSGLQQGRFTVVEAPWTGIRMALRAFDSGIALAERDENGRLKFGHGDGSPDYRTLDALKEEIRATLRAPAPAVAPPQAPELPPPAAREVPATP